MTTGNGPDISPDKKKVEFSVEPYLLYINGVPSGIIAGSSEEGVVSMYRGANLGKLLETDVLKAMPTMVAPFEDYMRCAMNGIYLQMMESRMAAMARGPRRS